MAILNNSNAISSGGYDVNNSLRFRSSATAYLNRTLTTPTNNKIWTWSGWVKIGALASFRTLFSSASPSTGFTSIRVSSDNTLAIFQFDGAAYDYYFGTSQVFRDPSAWYHIVIAMDTTQATNTNRMKLYVNGNQVTAFSSSPVPVSYPTQNLNTNINSAVVHRVGAGNYVGAVEQTFDGYMTDVYFIDGSQKAASDFGETDTTTGSWKPKSYTGTYGTNGFYLKFSDIATTSGSNAGLGKDFSGNTNYWTTNNISVTAGTTYDAMIDSPTLTSATVANYATLNPLNVNPTYASAYVASNGNLTVTATGITGVNFPWLAGTIAVNTGKWYWEVLMGTTGGGAPAIGIITSTSLNNATPFAPESWSYYLNGQKFAGATGSAYGATWTTGDLIGVALDCDAGTITFYKNNVSQGTAFSTGFTNLLVNPVLIYDASGTDWNCSINFGQRPFAYTPPSGFVRLNTYNLPDSTIVKGNTVMDATTYTGTGATQVVTNSGSMKPDLVWLKSRSNARDHRLMDTVRGINLGLQSNLTSAEFTGTALSSINSNGFTLNTTDNQNVSAESYIGWQWQAGQGTTSSNTSGTITSTVSVNATAGFSVVTYTGNGTTGATIGHGLGVAPKMMIIKKRSAAGDNWRVYHASLGATKFLDLNQTSAAGTASSVWNDTAPTSTVWTVGTNGEVNTSTATYVAYCWAAIPGFSAFGSYEGNASADGPMVYLGFKPKFVLIKRSSVAGNDWVIRDSSRDTYNTTNLNLYANLSDAEASGSVNIDFLSNGFKLRGSGVGANGSGTYIYMAFAENPFKNALAR
jgi:hypothetical protein